MQSKSCGIHATVGLCYLYVFSYSILKCCVLGGGGWKDYCNMGFLSLSLSDSAFLLTFLAAKKAQEKQKKKKEKMLTASNYLRGLRHASVCV